MGDDPFQIGGSRFAHNRIARIPPEETPEPTLTPTPVQGIRIIATGAPVIPTVMPQSGELIKIRYSHYWPPLGGVNTSRPDAPHLARTANGARWQDWVGRGCACISQWEFGTKVYIDGQEWTCVDRGSKIVIVDGVPWIDFLEEMPRYPHGKIVEATVRWSSS